MLIWKYPMHTSAATQIVETPKGSRPLHVNMQGGVLCVWMLVDGKAGEKEQHVFVVHGTGHDTVHEDSEYVGTVFDGPFVWHVFEVP